MRAGLMFASFNIRYYFLKTCGVQRELAAKARSLIAAVGDGSLEHECMEAVRGFERYERRVKRTLALVEGNCGRYIAGIRK